MRHRTMNRKAAVLLWIPLLFFLPGTRNYNISSVLRKPSGTYTYKTAARTHLWIRLNLKPSATQVAFAPEREYWCTVIVANLLLFRVVPNPHADVCIAVPAVNFSITTESGTTVADIPPDVEWKLETRDQNTLIYLARSVPKCMLACEGCQNAAPRGMQLERTSVSIET